MAPSAGTSDERMYPFEQCDPGLYKLTFGPAQSSYRPCTAYIAEP